MIGRQFFAACMAGCALSLDLLNKINMSGAGESNAEWKNANICITYGEDNSNSHGAPGKAGGDCKRPDPTCLATVSYKSPETPISNIGSLLADGTEIDVTLAGATWYEILGLGEEATVRQYIRILTTTLDTGSGAEAGDFLYFYYVFANSDGTLDGYLFQLDEGASTVTLQRYTKTGTTLPNLNVASAVPDLASAGFTLVHTDVEDGGLQVTTSPASATEGYHLVVLENVTGGLRREGTSDELAVVAAGLDLTAEVGIALTDASPSETIGDKITNAVLSFPMQPAPGYLAGSC